MHIRTAILVRRIVLGYRSFSPRGRGLNLFPATLQQPTAVKNHHWTAQRHNNVGNPNLSPIQQCVSSQRSTSRHWEQLSLRLSKTRVLWFYYSQIFLRSACSRLIDAPVDCRMFHARLIGMRSIKFPTVFTCSTQLVFWLANLAGTSFTHFLLYISHCI